MPVFSKSDLNKVIKGIKDDSCEIFEEKVVELHSHLIAITPKDTGHLQESWTDIEKIGECKYKFSNTAEYAHSILIVGKTDNNRGSDQLPEGILDTIRMWRADIKGVSWKRTRKLKFTEE